ncbi:MAG TPA: glycosyltransferase family 2 protein [Terriglobia bacterium]|nr:glycosyltransferase family 2 protein [Terriglobia bacterium]
MVKVSILVHNINRAAALKRCLLSIAKQGHRPLELILLDAGSTDNSMAIIKAMAEEMRERGIEFLNVSCPLKGVAASRNLATKYASGHLLCFLDNDAAFESSDDIATTADLFEQNGRLAVVSFRVLKADSSEIDGTAWVYRRSRDAWSSRPFRTFTFAGGASCVRAEAFKHVGGFWEHLDYAREEEDLGLSLLNHEWEIVYSPKVTVRHYSDKCGRSSLAKRRFVELRNGLLVLWRRLPIPLAILAIFARVSSMSLKAMLRRELSLLYILNAVPEAFQEWRISSLKRAPVSFGSAWKYASLHFER